MVPQSRIQNLKSQIGSIPLAAILLAAPALVLLLCCFLAPMLLLGRVSLYEGGGSSGFGINSGGFDQPGTWTLGAYLTLFHRTSPPVCSGCRYEFMMALFLSTPKIETLPKVIWPNLRYTLTPLVAAASSLTMLLTLLGLALAVWLLKINQIIRRLPRNELGTPNRSSR